MSNWNYTWSSEIVSLGVCSESADITAHLTSDCQPTPNDPTYKECVYSLPNGANLDLSTQVSINPYNDTKQSLAFGEFENFLSAFTLIGRNGSLLDNAYAQEHVWFL